MGLLKVLGWLFLPFIMIFVSWKNLKVVGKTFGIIWAGLTLLAILGNITGPVDPVAESVEKADVGNNTTEKESDADKISAKDAEKKKAAEAKAAKKKEAEEAKAAKDKEIADKKAAEEAEYNKPEKVYERWIQSQFSAWDGSATALKKSVKENMNNPKSFEHVETTYSDKGDMKGIDVYMKFRGTNSFGAIVTNKVHASYDYVEGTFTYEMVD
ncbi:beta-galactosidase [Paenibacillus sp. FJAT-27812]|uniref:beta-galactosidase n=1 Tax=Paenibacillus sp. FJAT-27812 TaxID=1684143 RepID=UPI0006A78765|nr:beta-galactosidase [Paenibacillus sp. FJAT-27812]